MGKIRSDWGAEIDENLCLGFGCRGKRNFAKVSDHGNVMQALEGEKKKCSKKDRSRLQQAQQDAKKAEEVLFISKIPFEALRLIK